MILNTKPDGVISIHALREEGDQRCRRLSAAWREFLSTPSARRATNDAAVFRQHGENFYPRPPRGGRRPHGVLSSDLLMISIHALREEGDIFLCS